MEEEKNTVGELSSGKESLYHDNNIEDWVEEGAARDVSHDEEEGGEKYLAQ